MNKKSEVIYPIAIDLGAKKTGVYYARYNRGTHYKDLKTKGSLKAQELEFEDYTLLLNNRTANRHARRGHDRTQFAKRLLKVILKEHFRFPVDEKGHMQALGFLVNRRGFTRIEGDFSWEWLEEFKGYTFKKVIVEIKNNDENNRLDNLEIDNAKDFVDFFAEKDISELKPIIDKMRGNIKKIKSELDYYGCIKEIKEYIKSKKESSGENTKKTRKIDLEKVNKWIICKLVQDGFSSLKGKCEDQNTFDLSGFLKSFMDERIKKEIDRIKDYSKQEKEAKKSKWNFNIETFDLRECEENGDFEHESNKKEKTYLHHFCFALNKIYEEKESGEKHRKKYFEEIKELFADPSKCSHNYFQNFIKYLGRNDRLHQTIEAKEKDKFYNILCHISNFELKPLRKYFNNEAYKDGKDRLDNKRLSEIFRKWAIKGWNVSESKDGEQKVKEYKDLKKGWKEHKSKGDVLSFFENTCPSLTIPPYQSMTNRRPPKCQTLLLNGDYLNEHYPKWSEWLKSLEEKLDELKTSETIFWSIEEYKAHLQDNCLSRLNGKSDKGNKPKSLLDNNQLKLRAFQFILDISQKNDPFKLSKIWSCFHKICQLEGEKGCFAGNNDSMNKEEELKKWKGDFEKQINESQLPNELKRECKNFKELESFGHFLNKYYKNRKSAKEGRYFLHQLKKNKWESKNNLLNICVHKPRQKKHQMGMDLASVFGISYTEHKDKLKNPDIEQWLDCISQNTEGAKLKSLCKKASDIQKKYKGELKFKIETLNDSNLTEDESKLKKCVKDCKKMAKILSKKLWSNESEKKQKEMAEKFSSIFSFAQIYNIVYADRSGFSSTCPVCSIDNNERMRLLSSGRSNGSTNTITMAVASRLSGLKVRIIDGAVMRICDVLSNKIIETQWPEIVKDLKNGHKVTVPLILEQNSFEFEPSLKKLKNKQAKQNSDTRKEEFDKKESRIKNDAKNICAYTGNHLGEGGEKDHIIPRASGHGTLNDEANLLYVSREGNKQKGDTFYTLRNLKDTYKKEIFETIDDDKIKDIIYETLIGGNSENVDQYNDQFSFGKYYNFTKLKNENQKNCFRHALFLEEGDELRWKVISSIKNLNRALVNGTQRYLAQCIADKIWRNAKKINKENNIQFDYFEYVSQVNHPKSVYELRKHFEEHIEEVKSLKKDKETKSESEEKNNKIQQKYGSHALDAHMVFLLACEDHKNKGTMGVLFNPGETIYEGLKDKNTGELCKKVVYEETKPRLVDYNIKLNRKKSLKGYRYHRSFHRATFYEQDYVPIFINDKLELRAGFNWKNSVKVKSEYHDIFIQCLSFAKNGKIKSWDNTDKELDLEDVFNFLKNKCGFKNKNEIFYVSWDKEKIHKFFVEKFSVSNSKTWEKWDTKVKFFMCISYRTENKNLEDFIKGENKRGNSDKDKDNKEGKSFFKKLEEFIKNEKNFKFRILNSNIIFPVKYEWKNLKTMWGNHIKQDSQRDKSPEEFKNFLNKYFKGNLEDQKRTSKDFLKSIHKGEANHIHSHQKARKVFSLPIVSKGGHYLQKRKSWTRKNIYQVTNDSDSRKDENKFSRPVWSKLDEEKKQAVNKPFNSENMFKLKDENNIVYDNFSNIPPDKWFCIERCKNFPEEVCKIEYKITNNTRPVIKISFENKIKKEGAIDKIIESNFTERNNTNNQSNFYNSDLVKPRKDKGETHFEKMKSNNEVYIEYTVEKFSRAILEKLKKIFEKGI